MATPILAKRRSGSTRSTRRCAPAASERGLFLLKKLEEQAQQLGIIAHVPPYSAYRNTIPLEEQGAYPGDLALEERITSIMRWNALAMVVRANQAYGELGGHIASYASAAEIFEVGFNHFFRAGDATRGGDLVFFQPHSAPGVYARAFLEGRLSRGAARELSAGSRRQRPVVVSASVADAGLLAVPDRLDGHRPDQRDLPGALHALSRASRHRVDTAIATSGACSATARWTSRNRSRALTLAARENLDNLTFVINCNLQRLDGPVRGNGQIIQELESLFIGAGWNVIKVLWGSRLGSRCSRATRTMRCCARFAATVDGQYQTLGANDGALQPRAFLRPRSGAARARRAHDATARSTR